MTQQTLVIASDHAGFALKEALKPVIEAEGFRCTDLGTHSESSVDYPDFGRAVAEAITRKEATLGIAICGSGIGISIAANRYKGVRAALCQTGLAAQLARQHNDANVLALGARLIGIEEAKDCVHRFLHTAFEGGRHAARIEKLG
jgi:ribose 5-phosphate isomerase B